MKNPPKRWYLREVLLFEGCEGLRVNQVGQRQKGRHSRDQQEHLIWTEYTSQGTVQRRGAGLSGKAAWYLIAPWPNCWEKELGFDAEGSGDHLQLKLERHKIQCARWKYHFGSSAQEDKLRETGSYCISQTKPDDGLNKDSGYGEGEESKHFLPHAASVDKGRNGASAPEGWLLYTVDLEPHSYF